MPRLPFPVPRHYLISTALVAACALLLVWWQPWRLLATSPAPPPVILSPVPAATATRAPERIALPSPSPSVSSAPRPTPVGAPATPTVASANSAPTGSLLYLGVVDGRPGIVASDADGTGRRLLAPGVYIALAWSLDGARFAALGGNGYEQLAIFTADGRALARYPLRAGTQCDLRWSPESRYVVCLPTYPFNGRERTTILIADETGLREALVPPVVRTAFLGWPVPGVLGLVGYPEEFPYAAAEVWAITLATGEAKRLIQGDFQPLGWSDNSTLLALGGRQPRGGTRYPGESVFTELIAIDIAMGVQRTMQRADQITRILTGTTPGMRYWFPGAQLSPDGSRTALWVARDPTTGTPTTPIPPLDLTFAILSQNRDGTLSRVSTVRPAEGSTFSYGWSPDSQVLAMPYNNQPSGPSGLLILHRDTPAPQRYPLNTASDPAITWSPDGRWCAYVGPQGLTVAATRTNRAIAIDEQGSFPAWRPAGR